MPFNALRDIAQGAWLTGMGCIWRIRRMWLARIRRRFPGAEMQPELPRDPGEENLLTILERNGVPLK